ncbi:sialate O-acetylesterase [Phormidium sp. CCY1219]|uniref:sialate O-acetylesterase n=1 Tax=Phormidium sp. CCY1219 TaxID=2886104 RepID=UPI002D786921|nr:sialate O-acetylesterase [Phormidium sp. CCY1219]
MNFKQNAVVGLISGVLLFSMTASEALFIRLFILAGQSNMVGYQSNLSQLPDRLQKSQPPVLWYNQNQEWEPLKAPTEPVLSADLSIPVPPFEDYHPEHSHKVKNKVGFGPEISLGLTLAKALNERVAMVKYSRNGTSLATQWDPREDAGGNPKNTLYPRMKERVSKAIADLKARGYIVEIAGFFWMQGESDASVETWAKDYEANLTHFIQTLREDYDRPNLPFIYGMVHFGNEHEKPNGSVNCCGDTVRSAQWNVQQSIPNTVAVETQNLSLHNDLLHFDSAGIIDLGTRFANAWLNLTSDSPQAFSERNAP